MSTLTKIDVQKRVLKDGKPLDLDLFEWNEETRTFSSNESSLVLDFNGLDNCSFKTGTDCTFNTGSGCTFNTNSECTFKTGTDCTFNTNSGCTFNTNSVCTFKTGSGCTFKTCSYCTFNTGSECTFKTGSGCTFKTGHNCTFDTGSYCTFDTGSYCTFNTGFGCTFKTGSYCTFKTGSYCTFKTGHNCTFDMGSDCTFTTGSECVFVRRDTFEVILLKEGIETILCPFNIKGYLEKIDCKFTYSEDPNKDNEYIIVDNVFSEIISKKGNILKVYNYGETKESYIVKDGDIYSHGETIKEARDSLVYKISSRDTSMYKDLTLDSILSKDECIRMYRVITGACEYGTRSFVSKKEPSKIKDKYSIRELIKLTKGQYGNDKLVQFLKGE